MITIEIRGEKEVIDALRDFKAESDLAIMKAFKKVGLLIQSAAKLRLKEMKHYITGRLASSIHSEVKEGIVHDNGEVSATTFDYKAEVSGEMFDGTLHEEIAPLELIVGTNVEYAEKIEVKYDSYLRFAAELGDSQLQKYVTEQINEGVKKANEKMNGSR